MTSHVAQRPHPERYIWTEDRLATALQLKADRLTNEEIAHELQTTRKVVQHKLAGHPGKNRKYRARPKKKCRVRIIRPDVTTSGSTRTTCTTHAADLRDSAGQPTKDHIRDAANMVKVGSDGIKWDETALSELKRMSANGAGHKGMAYALGVTEAAIEYGLGKIRRDNGPRDSHSQPKGENKLNLPCLGCQTMMWTTIEIRQCNGCKNKASYTSGYW